MSSPTDNSKVLVGYINKEPIYFSRKELEFDYKSEVVDMVLKEQSKERLNNQVKFFMISICPKDDTNFQIFKKKMGKLISKKWIDKYYYSFEWRDKLKGLHSHCEITLTKGTKKYKSEMIREIYNTFKSICEKQCIDIQINKGRGFKRYIDGYKKGLKKKNFDENVKNRLLFKVDNVITNDI